jgi:hypothetical protein
MESVAEPGYESLRGSVSELLAQSGVSVTKQSLDGRFNEQAALYIQRLLERIFATQSSMVFTPEFVPGIHRMVIKDATRFDLPAQLCFTYKGFGGKCTSVSALSIQYEFDLMSLKFISFEITSAREPDSAYSKIKQGQFGKGDLVLRDLGYYRTEAFAILKKDGAHFISRLNTLAKIMHEGKFIDFNTLYSNMLATGILHKDMDAELKIEKLDPVPVRLIATLVSEEVYRKRITEGEKRAKERGHKLSDETRARFRFSLIITSIPADEIETEKIYPLYRLRWQIELMFKHWKSTLGINKVQKMKLFRFKCMIYAKLIYIMLTCEIISLARSWYYKSKGDILSIDKCFKTLVKDKNLLRAINEVIRENSTVILTGLFNRFQVDHNQEKRKNRVNFEDIVALFRCISDI